MSEKQLKGQVCITRDNHGVIHISLQDGKSGIEAVEIHCTAANFANALMHSTTPCKFTWRPRLVGKKHECKVEKVEYDCNYDASKEAREQKITESLKPFEVNGWVGNRQDLENHHRLIRGAGKPTYSVSFHRYV